MLYILLIIIAVGVLLISKAGQGILKLLGWLIVIAVILFLGFGLITGSTVLISSNWESIKNFIFSIPILLALLFAWVVVFIIIPNYFIKLFGTKKENPETLKEEKKEYTFQESQDRGKLGVNYNSSKEDIRSAYVELAKKYNPHGSIENREKFSEIHDAYKRLTKKD